VTIDELGALDRVSFARAVGRAFEHAPWIAEGAWEARPFASVDDLHRRDVRRAGRSSPTTASWS
jgi:2-oxo-4-hydroxy-4-carboxy-5-ureidoimidazoline decarboxylase